MYCKYHLYDKQSITQLFEWKQETLVCMQVDEYASPPVTSRTDYFLKWAKSRRIPRALKVKQAFQVHFYHMFDLYLAHITVQTKLLSQCC